MSVVAYTAWEIWNQRNKNYFDNKPFVVLDIIQRAENRWREEMASWEDSKPQREKQKVTPRWIQPNPSKYKLNADVAVSLTGRVGLGFILWDHSGDVELAGKCKICAAGSTHLLEGLGVRYGLQMARQYHHRVDSVECDNKEIVEGVNGGASLSPYSDIVVQDIKLLMSEVGCSVMNLVPHLANQVAHEIAHGPVCISIRKNPSHISEFICKDVIV